VTPDNDCRCDRSMRANELSALGELGRDPVLIARRDEPVTGLQDLARLVPVRLPA
jgi:hypothetical protein